MKKNAKLANIRPPKDVCAKCKSAGICQAETGDPRYKCPKILHPDIDL